MTASLRQRLLGIIDVRHADSDGEALDDLMLILASDEGAVEVMAGALWGAFWDEDDRRSALRAALAALARHVREG